MKPTRKEIFRSLIMTELANEWVNVDISLGGTLISEEAADLVKDITSKAENQLIETLRSEIIDIREVQEQMPVEEWEDMIKTYIKVYLGDRLEASKHLVREYGNAYFRAGEAFHDDACIIEPVFIQLVKEELEKEKCKTVIVEGKHESDSLQTLAYNILLNDEMLTRNMVYDKVAKRSYNQLTTE